MRERMAGACTRVRPLDADHTPGPSRARWMEGGGTVRLHHQRQLGLLTARGICMRTLRIPTAIRLIFRIPSVYYARDFTRAVNLYAHV